jgi:hypothetical protein
MAKITQAQLSKILKQRAKIAAAQALLDQAEDVVFQALKDGAAVQSGILIAEIKKTQRRNVAWRQSLEAQIDKRDGEGKGKELADRILAATHADEYSKLEVTLVK